MDFFEAWALTVGIEATALFLFHRKRHSAALILQNAIIASSLTLPFVWFVFPQIGLWWGAQTALAEAFAVSAEAGYYTLAFKDIKPKDALLSSVLCNCVSFFIGLAAG